MLPAASARRWTRGWWWSATGSLIRRWRIRGSGRGADRAAIATLTRLLGLEPDLTLVLDIGEAEAQARMLARGLPPDRYDRLGPDFHARVAAGFRAIAAAAPERCVVVPATGSAEAVQARIRAVLPPGMRPA